MRFNWRYSQTELVMSHQGRCFCGAVEIEVSGEPEGMGYCHCSSCRSWSGGPVNAFSLWKPESVRVVEGAEHVAMFSKTAFSERQYCKKCGGHLMTNHPPIALIDVYAATIPTLQFKPITSAPHSSSLFAKTSGGVPSGLLPSSSTDI